MNLKRRIRESQYARHIVISICLIVVVLTIGVVGYILIEHMTFTQALYMTIITISTVGFREVKPQTTAGMYFTILIIVTGVSAVLFFLAGAFEYVLSEVLGDVWGRRRMMNNISKLTNHYIICGYGRVGMSVAEELSDQGKRFVVIERDEERFNECVRDGHYAVHGSATENENMVGSGIERAVGLVSALRSDADNLFVVLTARTMNPNLLLVARADQPESEQKLEMVGADRVISPHKIAGKRMANLLVRPGSLRVSGCGDGQQPARVLPERVEGLAGRRPRRSDHKAERAQGADRGQYPGGAKRERKAVQPEPRGGYLD